MSWKNRIELMTVADLMAVRIWAREQVDHLEAYMRTMGEKPEMVKKVYACRAFLEKAERELHRRIEEVLRPIELEDLPVVDRQ